jgi:hypothetical protein
MDESQAASIIASYVANRFTITPSAYDYSRVRVWVQTREPNDQFPEQHWWVGVSPLDNEEITEGYVVYDDGMYCCSAEVPPQLGAYITEIIEKSDTSTIIWNVN